MVLPLPQMAAGNHAPRRRSGEAGVTPMIVSSAMPRVAALVLGRLDGARLQDAVRNRAILEQVETITALEQLVARSVPRVAAVICEPLDIDAMPTAPALARMRAEFPGVALIGYCTPGHKHSAEILALARPGVQGRVSRGVDDTPAALRQALARASQTSAAREVLNALRPIVQPRMHWILEAGVLYAWPELSSTELAQTLGMNAKTLVKHCREGGLPSPGALLNWIRLMIVAYLLEAEGRALEPIATALGLESASPLRNLMKRYTGLRPTEVREAGGLKVVVQAFQREDAFGRGGGRPPRQLPARG